ncbi:MAG: histidine kinase, partial [Candidatus Phosphoribacter sp.]
MSSVSSAPASAFTKDRDLVELGSTLGGIVAWAGVVVPTALNYRRNAVPAVWWALAVVILVCFIVLPGTRRRPRVSDRIVLAVMIAAGLGACAVWGGDVATPVFLVLNSGVAGFVISTRGSMFLVAGQTAYLFLILTLQNTTVVWALLYGALMFFAALMVHVVMREKGAVEAAAAVAAELESANSRLVATNAALLQAQSRLSEASRVEERLRISRDLHDGLGSQLTALTLHLDLIARSVDGPAAEYVAQAKALAALVIGDIRSVVSQLRGSQVSPRDQIARFARSLPRPSTSLDITEALDEAPAPVAEAIMRVVQEALTNAARHGGATHVKVVVREDPEDPAERAAAERAAAERAAAERAAAERAAAERAAADRAAAESAAADRAAADRAAADRAAAERAAAERAAAERAAAERGAHDGAAANRAAAERAAAERAAAERAAAERAAAERAAAERAAAERAAAERAAADRAAAERAAADRAAAERSA